MDRQRRKGWNTKKRGSRHLNMVHDLKEGKSWIDWDPWIVKRHLCPLSDCAPDDRHNPLLGVNMHIVVQSFIVPLLMSSLGFFCFVLICSKTWCILWKKLHCIRIFSTEKAIDVTTFLFYRKALKLKTKPTSRRWREFVSCEIAVVYNLVN